MTANRIILVLCPVVLVAAALPRLSSADERPNEPGVSRESWVEPMRQVHSRFTGTPGTLAQFGDSITVTMAFWAPLAGDVKNANVETARAHQLVKEYMQPECWREWKGPEYGSNGSMTTRWAHDNVDRWLEKLDPETVVIMFGTNDLTSVPLEEYEQKTRQVVQRCLDNGTVVILTTIPPRSGLLDKSKEYANAVRRLARELKVPLCDYQAEILKRRPDDWDGTLEKFAGFEGYDVPTLLSRDGVHPSNPRAHISDFSEEGLSRSGYGLRNYLTLRTYARLIEMVLQVSMEPGCIQ